jgi:hypothetical protein
MTWLLLLKFSYNTSFFTYRKVVVLKLIGVVLEELDIHMQKNKTRPLLMLYTKIESNNIEDKNARHETIRMGNKLLDIG